LFLTLLLAVPGGRLVEECLVQPIDLLANL
jgi:hypothetical protein